MGGCLLAYFTAIGAYKKCVRSATHASVQGRGDLRPEAQAVRWAVDHDLAEG